MINKFKRIIFSRFKKPKEEPWIKKRREVCKNCPFNSKINKTNSFKVIIIMNLSKLFSKITNRIMDNLGECLICGCSIYYKSAEKEENCEATPSKWDNIIE